MATPQQITDTLIQDAFVRAIKDVFGTMMSQEISFVERRSAVEAPTPEAKLQIVGNVGFVGNVNGLVYLCLPEDFAKEAAARMLGMDPAELALGGNEAMNDVIGEISNMTVGGFKNTLADVGYPCRLTVPTIVRARGLQVSCFKGAIRNILHFDCKAHRISADIQMKLD